MQIICTSLQADNHASTSSLNFFTGRMLFLMPSQQCQSTEGNPRAWTSLPAALRAAQTCRYLVYSEADFEVFRPAGATGCTDGGEIWHGGGDWRNSEDCYKVIITLPLQPKTLSFFCLFVCLFSVCLFVLLAFERQRLCTRFRHEGVSVQKRFWCRWVWEGL